MTGIAPSLACSLAQRVAKNTFFLLLSKIVTHPISFIVEIYLARYLDVALYGKYTFAFSFVAIFSVISDFSLVAITSREVNKYREKAGIYLGTTLTLRFILGVVAFFMVIVFINVLSYPRETALIAYIVGASLIVTTLNNGFIAMYNGFERMEYTTIVTIIWKASGAIYIIAMILLHRGIFIIAVSAFLSAAIALAANIYFSSRNRIKPSFKMDVAKYLMKETFPIFLSSFVMIIYLRISNIFLSKVKGDIAVGLYNSADSLIRAMLFFPASVIAALFPVIGTLYVDSIDSLRRAYSKTAKYLFLIGLPVALGGSVLGEEIMVFLFGESFRSGAIVLRIIVWQMFFMYLSDLYGNTLVGIGKQKIVFYVICLCTITNIALNSVLIPRFGIVGASVTMLITEFIPFAIHPLIIHRYIKYAKTNEIISVVARAAAAVVLMGCIVNVLGGYHLLLRIGAGTIIYFSCLSLFRVIKNDDVMLFRDVMRGIRV
ncbi:MAG: flippase [Nitrospirae bacterium]|nr:flippase [Nitrospirota bacterium]